MSNSKANEKMVKTKVIAELFDLTPRRIQQLTQEEILTAKKVGNENQYELYQTVKDYLNYIKLQIDEKSTPELIDLEMLKLKAEVDIKQAKAKMAQLDLKELQGQMHRSEDVEFAITDMALNIKSILLALPGRLAVDVLEAKTPAAAQTIIKNSVNNILTELSNYQYDADVYKTRVRERKKWSAEIESDTEEKIKPNTKSKQRTKTTK